ncbi:MAG: type I methionyl aminopeptidase [Verrucomicrobiae bacterium]|nr:type I methionyl aminopeptidase [Verrucomicrobiae bacterium]NNJ86880.1 type I methionyl aminopeptidase [Akkermansiaceae bacterium]
MARKIRIPIKTAADIKKMRVACETASEILQLCATAVKPGATTGEIDRYAGELMRERGCKSAFLGYRGFPGQICISRNEEVVHGIGSETVIKPGDILKIDVGITKGGWIGDNATTVPAGDITLETKRLMCATEQSLYEAIEQARPGNQLADVCGAVEAHVRKFDFTVVREFVGHGVGRDLHEEPQVPNYRPPGRSPKLRPGMVLAIEPMVNAGVAGVTILEDGWTVVTNDRKNSSHFEHTVLITNGKPDILTARPREATESLLGISMGD